MSIAKDDYRVASKLAHLRRIGERVRAGEASQVEAYALALVLRDELLALGWDTTLGEDGFTVVLTEHEEAEK